MRNLILLLTMLFSSVTFGALSEVDRQEIGYTNYIKNGGCESGVAGLGRYADTGTRPVDGTGGAPTVSVSASATAPLIGKASCIFTKSAANSQGQGWSIPFTIEEGAKGKVLSVEFLYKVDSGTFAAGSPTTDSDVIAYLYDVTNGVVIEPTSFKLFSNSTTLADKFSGYFQAPSNSTSYRLIFHVATVSASAYALKVDDIAVSRSKITSGAVVTDWKSYTLTIGGATTAPTPGTNTSFAFWRRVGDTMEIRYEFSQTTAGSGGTGVYKFPLPSGYTADSSKVGGILGAGQSLGSFTAFNGTLVFEGHVQQWDTTNLYGYVGEAASNTSNISSTFLGLGNATIRYGFEAKVPIVGWSSNVQLSSDAGNSVLAARMTGGSQAINSTAANIDFNAVTFDSGGMASTATDRFTAQSPGYYQVIGKFYWTGGAGTAQGTIAIKKNGTLYADQQHYYAGSGTYPGLEIASVVYLNTNDYVELQKYNGVAGTISSAVFEIYKISNPQTIAASDTIALSYNSTSAQAVGTSSTLITYGNRDYDLTGSYSAGVFTAPMSGKYKVQAAVLMGPIGLGTSASGQLQMRKNGTLYRVLGSWIGSGASNYYGANGSTVLHLNAGETVSIYALIGNATNLTSASGTENFLTIERVGN